VARKESPAEWLTARKELLTKEKDFTHPRDAVGQARRSLPWVKVEKEYVFEAPGGREPLAKLFDGRSQLIVYHFLFGPDWKEGSCSLVSEHFHGPAIHLA
jgi:predicted dithiol-disulfide oxidoreductase (DUF899 family)